MKFIPVALFAAAVSASCGRIPQKRTADGTGHVFHFSYSGDHGPLNWHHIVADSDTCAHGRHQSPIDLNPKSVTFSRRGDVRIDIPTAESAKLENLGAGLEVVLTNGTLTTPDNTYQLVQFHWHTPSEHRINQEHFPLEAHFVFQDAENHLAVVGFLAQLSESGHSTCLFDNVFKQIDAVRHPGDYAYIGPLDFSEIARHLDRNPPVQYNGSLTTPPCSEGVRWYVSSQPLPLSVKSYNAVKRLLKFNARYIQNTLGSENLLDLASHD
ncbi:hypothetical protein FE257_012327 [Aspergillus nanangensis]|uniref:Carbonic anhydrase n=1 Tax=Aspergillus nanangensis TaxID=2582783 RepID=A0AAD4CG59_ASPNN|nr:hypothetical protein FE257_012327 [Aspergillus nanangensis]